MRILIGLADEHDCLHVVAWLDMSSSMTACSLAKTLKDMCVVSR